MKAQAIRLVDVFALGPFMVWAGAQRTALPDWARYVLIASGIGTVAYNARNYLAIRGRAR